MQHTTLLAVLLVVCPAFSYVRLAAQERRNEIPEAVENSLRRATRFELFALDPAQKGAFHGWKVVENKQRTVKDEATRNKIANELKRAVSESDGIAPREFEKPQYGVRAVHQGKSTEFVISFKERKAIVYVDGKQLTTVRLTASPVKYFEELLTKE